MRRDTGYRLGISPSCQIFFLSCHLSHHRPYSYSFFFLYLRFYEAAKATCLPPPRRRPTLPPALLSLTSMFSPYTTDEINVHRVVYAAVVGDFYPIGITNAFGCLVGIAYSVVYLRNCWHDGRAGVRQQAWIFFAGAVSIVG